MMEPIAIALRAAGEVKALRVGSIDECLALYADDMLLFLQDPKESLVAALCILNTFSQFSGLKVNWTKSSILPLDAGARDVADPALPLQWVTQLTYLGVKITARVEDYMPLNLAPLLLFFKQKIQAWQRLPLSLIGRINLLKMKILPVILYFLRNAPIWIPKSFFKKLDGLTSTFLWAPKQPRIGLKTLQEPWGEGGLALPDWKKYYLAGQMVFVHRWLTSDEGDSATVLEAAHLGSYETLRFAIHRGVKMDLPLTVSMRASIKAWEAAVDLANPSYRGLSPSTPLWMNPKLSHFYSFDDPMGWATRGIKTLKDVTMDGELLTFDQLKARHDLPNNQLFRYLQLRHALKSQFKVLAIESVPSRLEEMLSTEDLPKTLSVSYKKLFATSPGAVVKCRDKWVSEVPDIQGEDWDEMWTHPFQHLVAARDRLIHFKFLHRIYYTPARLATIYPSVPAGCWRCTFAPAAAEHVFWSCPRIKPFWSEVTSCISAVLLTPVPMTITVCLLGLVEGVVPSRAHRTLLNILLFYGRKAILLKWRKPEAPELRFWKGLVNSMMPYYKATYLSRGCGKKFDKVWQAWYNSDLTVG